ncbi:PREDICTED: YTH domain-containing family protein 3-like isoform X2 [Lupinus angustifolius]|uniref:YTH domain-containing family protein 3-like isoform X2 n=1 Tax=Lupinus angustifolius TaxID=3871 RepID=UPI00092F09B9|nr:PREDICTED: YTH domain-containing family protein 3-like isoform X2 [Lupinus angustifolius]
MAPSSDKAADLLHNLSLDSEPEIIGVPDPSKKNGHVFSNGTSKGMSKPFNPNPSYTLNGYPSTAYYYGGYDEQGDWNAYNRYMNHEGAMAPGVYGDSSPYMYHQGYGFTPYGAYPPPNSSSPPIQHDGQLYGLQQYQYPGSYHQSPDSDVSFVPNKISAPQGEISAAVNANHDPSSSVMNKRNTSSMTNGASLPAYVPLSEYQGPRMSSYGAQSAVASNVSLVSDRQSKHVQKVGLSSPALPVKDFTPQRNERLPQPLPQFTNLHGSRHPYGLDLVSGFINGMYPSNYSQYGNTLRNSRFGSAAYGSGTRFVDNKFKSTNNGYGVGRFKKNLDGFSELNKGPRAVKSSDTKTMNNPGPVTLLLKGQDISLKSDNKEAPAFVNNEQYNGKTFSENYSNAKIFVIKSYSEDDIHKSIKYSVWASTPIGNKKLDAAYQEAKEKPGGCPIFLLFSVNTSGQFVGLAEMVGPVDFNKTVEYWQQDRWTGCFSVKWHVIKDIPNSVLRHITLENNENKPVTNSRDTQEVKFEKGTQIVKIFKEHSSQTCILDDFEFYEGREKVRHERKSQEQQLPKQAIKPSDLIFGTVILPKSVDRTLMKESANKDASEGNGSTTALEGSSKSC